MDGNLFRPTTADRRRLVNRPFTGNNPSNRVRLYSSSSSDDGDLTLRPHGGRAGVAATLRLLGATEQQVMDHCRWGTYQTFKHYTQVEKVTRRRTTVQMLKEAMHAQGESQAPTADLAGEFYNALNSNFKAERAFRGNEGHS